MKQKLAAIARTHKKRILLQVGQVLVRTTCLLCLEAVKRSTTGSICWEKSWRFQKTTRTCFLICRELSSASQPSEPLPLPQPHSYYASNASNSPAFAAPSSPPVAQSKPKFESALSKKQVDAYDPPLPSTTQRQQRKTSANAPTSPFQVAAPPYARPPSAAALRTFSLPPLVNSSPLNPARPPSRGPTSHRPPSRTASRNAVLPPPPAPLSVGQPPLATPQRLATPPSIPPPARQVLQPPLTLSQEPLKSPILSVQPPAPASPKKQPDPLPSLALLSFTIQS
jgi:hypothetical protein